MTSRGVFDFAAGPGVLPAEVLARAREELTDWGGTGTSVLEMPFTGPAFKAIAAAAREDLQALLSIPPRHTVLFMQGGASAQFAIVPMNLLRLGRRALYVETGHWSRRAIAEARRFCEVRIAASSAGTGFDRIPAPAEWRLDPDAAFCHVTTNETADGLEYHWTPDTGDVPLVADMTSSLLSRPLDVGRYGLIYAAAQKNIGPAGLTVVIVREDLLGVTLPGTPSVFDYKVQAGANSMYNTPPTWAIYVAGLVFRWLRQRGGLEAIEQASIRKSARVYAAIDRSQGFYRGRALARDRSRTTVCFALREPSLTGTFLEAAAGRGLLNLAGHPAVGGIRAALYNAMPEEGAVALAAMMDDFARAHG